MALTLAAHSRPVGQRRTCPHPRELKRCRKSATAKPLFAPQLSSVIGALCQGRLPSSSSRGAIASFHAKLGQRPVAAKWSAAGSHEELMLLTATSANTASKPEHTRLMTPDCSKSRTSDCMHAPPEAAEIGLLHAGRHAHTSCPCSLSTCGDLSPLHRRTVDTGALQHRCGEATEPARCTRDGRSARRARAPPPLPGYP